jgi:hypothetical protein
LGSRGAKYVLHAIRGGVSVADNAEAEIVERISVAVIEFGECPVVVGNRGTY